VIVKINVQVNISACVLNLKINTSIPNFYYDRLLLTHTLLIQGNFYNNERRLFINTKIEMQN